MSTNGINACEDTEMAECDGEKVVTMMDVLKEQEDFEEDVNAVLGASDDKNCTYSKGYIKRQAIYACRTCCPDAADDPDKRAGVCLACSLSCHEKHELIELYTKRNFRCDCGNHKFNSHPCQFTPTKTETNEENSYNQNFSGVYCTCHRPYPDPEATMEQEMIQCIVCEDWFHSSHLDAVVPLNEDYSEMICKECMNKNEFLYDYTEHTVNKENVDVDVLNVSSEFTDTANELSISNTKKSSNNDTVNDNEIKMDSDNIENESIENVTGKTNLTQQCNIELQSADENMQEEPLDDTNPMMKEKEFVELSKDDTDLSENKDYVNKSAQVEFTVTDNSVYDNKKDKINSETEPNNSEQLEEMELLINAETDPKEIKEGKFTINNTEENILETDLTNCEQTEKNKLTESCEALQLHISPNCEKNSTELMTPEINQELAEEDLLLRDPVENEDINKSITTNAGASEKVENNDDKSDDRDIISESKAENPKDCESLQTISKSETECTEDSKAHNEDTSTDFIMNENNDNKNIISNVRNEDKQVNDTKVDNDKHQNDTIENNVIEDNANTDDKDKEDNTAENKHRHDNDNLNNKQENNEEQEADIPDNKEEQDDIKGNTNHIECTDETVTQASIQKRKLLTKSDENESGQKKQKMDERPCVRPRGIKKIHKGATFWPSNFRHKLCTCNECILMYKDLSVLFLIDPDDTVTAYEQLGKEKTHGKPASQYEKGMAALSSLGRVQQINALTEYSKLRDKLLEFLKSFQERKVIVKEEDIKAFFAGMKPVREPDGVYFCR